MSNTPTLPIEEFEICRICLLQMDSKNLLKFINIFGQHNGGFQFDQKILELLGIKVELDDYKPKVICEKCLGILLNWIAMKKKAAQSQIFIDYNAWKKELEIGGGNIPCRTSGTSNASNNSLEYDLCRICLLKLETNNDVKFVHIFLDQNTVCQYNQPILELLGIKVEKDDIKPKIICENCLGLLMSWTEMKGKAAETQMIIDYYSMKKGLEDGGFTNSQISNASNNSSQNSRTIAKSTEGSNSVTNMKSTSPQLNRTRCKSVTSGYEERLRKSFEKLCVNVNENKKLYHCDVCQKNTPHNKR